MFFYFISEESHPLRRATRDPRGRVTPHKTGWPGASSSSPWELQQRSRSSHFAAARGSVWRWSILSLHLAKEPSESRVQWWRMVVRCGRCWKRLQKWCRAHHFELGAPGQTPVAKLWALGRGAFPERWSWQRWKRRCRTLSEPMA